MDSASPRLGRLRAAAHLVLFFVVFVHLVLRVVFRLKLVLLRQRARWQGARVRRASRRLRVGRRSGCARTARGRARLCGGVVRLLPRVLRHGSRPHARWRAETERQDRGGLASRIQPVQRRNWARRHARTNARTQALTLGACSQWSLKSLCRRHSSPHEKKYGLLRTSSSRSEPGRGGSRNTTSG